MNTSQLLILYKEHSLSTREIGLILNIPQKMVKSILRGRIKSTKTKRSWQKKFRQ